MVNNTIIKVKSETYARLEKRKGFNGCVSFDDVIKFIMDQEEENNMNGSGIKNKENNHV